MEGIRGGREPSILPPTYPHATLRPALHTTKDQLNRQYPTEWRIVYALSLVLPLTNRPPAMLYYEHDEKTHPHPDTNQTGHQPRPCQYKPAMRSPARRSLLIES